MKVLTVKKYISSSHEVGKNLTDREHYISLTIYAVLWQCKLL